MLHAEHFCSTQALLAHCTSLLHFDEAGRLGRTRIANLESTRNSISCQEQKEPIRNHGEQWSGGEEAHWHIVTISRGQKAVG